MSQFGITLKNTSSDVVLHVAGNGKFRVIPKGEPDEKGRIKPFKPDPKDPYRHLGGLKAEFKDVKKDTWVMASVYRNVKGIGPIHLTNLVVIVGKEEDEEKEAPPKRPR